MMKIKEILTKRIVQSVSFNFKFSELHDEKFKEDSRGSSLLDLENERVELRSEATL